MVLQIAGEQLLLHAEIVPTIVQIVLAILLLGMAIQELFVDLWIIHPPVQSIAVLFLMLPSAIVMVIEILVHQIYVVLLRDFEFVLILLILAQLQTLVHNANNVLLRGVPIV